MLILPHINPLNLTGLIAGQTLLPELDKASQIQLSKVCREYPYPSILCVDEDKLGSTVFGSMEEGRVQGVEDLVQALIRLQWDDVTVNQRVSVLGASCQAAARLTTLLQLAAVNATHELEQVLQTGLLSTALAYTVRMVQACQPIVELHYEKLSELNLRLTQAAEKYNVCSWYDDTESLPLERLKDLSGQFTLRSLDGCGWQLEIGQDYNQAGTSLSELVMETIECKSLDWQDSQG